MRSSYPERFGTVFMLNCTHPSVVLVDLSMPVLDGALWSCLLCSGAGMLTDWTFHAGIGATAQMRDIEASKRSALIQQGAGHEARRSSILALTGMSSLDDKKRAFDAGVDG